jgi:hypothetical protein
MNSFSQIKPDSSRSQPDTLKILQSSNDSLQIDSSKNHVIKDSSNVSLLADSMRVNTDSQVISGQPTLNGLLKKNKLLNLKQKAVPLTSNKRNSQQKDYLFYLLSGIFLLFGFFKIFYSQYFNNIFRVFFNTSLRQNQLTDLLLQAKLPSLIFNVFFLIMGGFYVWLLLRYYYLINGEDTKTILPLCILIISLVYVFKFCALKFIGWVTGMIQPLNTYVFVVFLVNKIAGVVLLPFVILLAFTSPLLQSSVVILSYLTIGILFLLRFIRSYGLLQNQLNISRLHFFLYILSIEILPLLVVYKLFLKLIR